MDVPAADQCVPVHRHRHPEYRLDARRRPIPAPPPGPGGRAAAGPGKRMSTTEPIGAPSGWANRCRPVRPGPGARRRPRTSRRGGRRCGRHGRGGRTCGDARPGPGGGRSGRPGPCRASWSAGAPHPPSSSPHQNVSCSCRRRKASSSIASSGSINGSSESAPPRTAVWICRLSLRTKPPPFASTHRPSSGVGTPQPIDGITPSYAAGMATCDPGQPGCPPAQGLPRRGLRACLGSGEDSPRPSPAHRAGASAPVVGRRALRSGHPAKSRRGE